jgi:heterodisulfide reductase subunit A-like polyferredoxin
MMASKTKEDEMVLKGNEGKTTYMLKDMGSREWVNNMRYITTVDCIFKSVYAKDIQNPCNTCSGMQKLYADINAIGSITAVYFRKKNLMQNI